MRSWDFHFSFLCSCVGVLGKHISVSTILALHHTSNLSPLPIRLEWYSAHSRLDFYIVCHVGFITCVLFLFDNAQIVSVRSAAMCASVDIEWKRIKWFFARRLSSRWLCLFRHSSLPIQLLSSNPLWCCYTIHRRTHNERLMLEIDVWWTRIKQPSSFFISPHSSTPLRFCPTHAFGTKKTNTAQHFHINHSGPA